MKPILKFSLIGIAMLSSIAMISPLFSYGTDFLQTSISFSLGLIVFFGSLLFATSLEPKRIWTAIGAGIFFAALGFYFSPNNLEMYRFFDKIIPHDRSTCYEAYYQMDDHSIGAAVGVGIEQLMTSVAFSFACFIAVLRFLCPLLLTRLFCFLLGILYLLPVFFYFFKKTTGHQLLSNSSLVIAGFFLVLLALFSRRIVARWPDGMNMGALSPGEEIRTRHLRH